MDCDLPNLEGTIMFLKGVTVRDPMTMGVGTKVTVVGFTEREGQTWAICVKPNGEFGTEPLFKLMLNERRPIGG